jgi:hypothetical protein
MSGGRGESSRHPDSSGQAGSRRRWLWRQPGCSRRRPRWRWLWRMQSCPGARHGGWTLHQTGKGDVRRIGGSTGLALVRPGLPPPAGDPGAAGSPGPGLAHAVAASSSTRKEHAAQALIFAGFGWLLGLQQTLAPGSIVSSRAPTAGEQGLPELPRRQNASGTDGLACRLRSARVPLGFHLPVCWEGIASSVRQGDDPKVGVFVAAAAVRFSCCFLRLPVSLWQLQTASRAMSCQ